MKRLKILFLPSRSWYPSEADSVTGVFIKEHAKAVSLYNDVTVLYAYFSTNRSFRKPFQVSDQVEDGIRTIRIACRWKVPLSNFLLYYWGIFACFRKLVKEGWRPDIIHVHVFPAGLPAWLLSRVFKTPFVITEHYTRIATHSLTFCGQKGLKFACRRAKAILPVSKDLREALQGYYGIENKFFVVPNVVNTEMFYPTTRSINNKKHVIKRVLLVANLTARKGVSYLLEALSQIKQKRRDFHLDIVGDGPNRSEYEGLVRSLGLDEMVKFYGRQPEVASFMRKCDFFVLPSLYENFGVVYIEAMACGKPVIATNAGGPREIVNKEVGILVPPKNVKALKNAIEYMLDNSGSYSAERISQYAKERFSYEAVGKMLDGVYEEVLSNFATESRKQIKWKAGWSRHTLRIEEDWQVLDIGSGHNPHPRADLLVDKELGISNHRSGKAIKFDREKPLVLADAQFLPFQDKVFDYVIALHVAEHVDNPKAFCKELMRVGKRGYIETPSKLCEKLLGEPVHKCFVYKKGSTLVFEKKRKATGLKWFYGLFYYGRERIGHPKLTVSSRAIHLLLTAVNYAVLRLWSLKLVSKLMYTSFEWKETFAFEVG